MDSTALKTLRRQYPITTVTLSLIVAGVLAVLFLAFLSFAFDRVPVYTRNIAGHVQNLLSENQAEQEKITQALLKQLTQAQQERKAKAEQEKNAQAEQEKITQVLREVNAQLEQEKNPQAEREKITKAEQERSLYCFRTMNATKAATLKELYECTHAKQHP